MIIQTQELAALFMYIGNKSTISTEDFEKYCLLIQAKFKDVHQNIGWKIDVEHLKKSSQNHFFDVENTTITRKVSLKNLKDQLLSQTPLSFLAPALKFTEIFVEQEHAKSKTVEHKHEKKL